MSAGEWLRALPGMLVMLVLGALIALPGLFLASTETLMIDRELGFIVKRIGMGRFGIRVKALRVHDVEKVIGRRTTKKQTDRRPGSTAARTSSTTVYPLDLEMNDGSTVHLSEYTEKAAAKAVAERFSSFGGLALDDRL